MADPRNRRDEDPWQKVHAVKEVRRLLEKGASLSTSLRMSKFSPVGGRVKKPAVDWMCEGAQQPAEPFVPKSSIQFEMRLKSRLMVNHSGGVMENASLAVHPHFGTPQIPGSAVKGIARHAAWCDWKDAGDGEKDLYAEFIAEIFGFPTGDADLDANLKKAGIQTRSGTFAFLSANVAEQAKLEADLINSHERGNPVPVFFPAVAAGTVFSFAMIPLRRKTATDMDTLGYFAEDWLKKGLRQHGVGAKTNAGYGWFEEAE